MGERVETLLAHMTLEEKVSMLAGATMWTTVPVERLGIPAIKVTDGPNGARGGSFRGGPSSACVPVGIALAATWNPQLVEQVGVVLGQEAKTKGARILLAPTVNIHRSPLNGRNFECYSEDPYLSGRMAVAYIEGVQSEGVGACVKHFVCNDSEFERQSISSEVRERTLREIYLPPFKAAVQEAGTWCVMSAYNKLNGTYCSENPYVLIDILKKEWGFDGIVMSDWFGTNSVDIANGGMDLEMPGPARWMGEKVLEAARTGQIKQEVIDDKVRRLLYTIERAGAFEHPEIPPERSVDKPEHRRVARRAAAESMVLLKNKGHVLPLDLSQIDSIAIIGPNAKTAQIQGGGSAGVNPHYVVTPYQGLVDRVGDAARVGYALGCTNHRMLPQLAVDALTTEEGNPGGLTARYYNNQDLAGKEAHIAVVSQTQLMWLGPAAPGVDPQVFSVRLSGTFTAQETGVYTLGLVSAGLSRLSIDGKIVIDNWTDQKRGETFLGMGSAEIKARVEMEAGRVYDLTVEYSSREATMLRGLQLGCLPPVPESAIDDAAALAAKSDVALLFVGLTGEWESEGYDRPDLELRGRQVELIEKVAAANENTVVVLNTGSPIRMPWLDKVAAVVQAWYPGQEAGNAMADVLLGDVNPSGRLPQTFPRRLQDNPAYLNYPGENGKVYYGENLFVGYRYYDKKGIEPLFPFGYGLSYTTFACRNLVLDAAEYAPGDTIRVGVDVQNTGSRAGQEVVQLYIRDVACSLTRPDKELKGFAKVALEPGETKTVSFELGPEALAFYDPAQKSWVVEAGEFEVLVGSSARDIALTASFVLTEGIMVGKKATAAPRLHIDMPLQVLLQDEAGKAVLEKHIAEMLQAPQLSMAMGMSLPEVARFVPQILTEEKLAAIAEDLAAV